MLKSFIFIVKSFLGNFYRHLAIFSGHTGPPIDVCFDVDICFLQEPSLLSSLQDNGLTDVVLHALLVKDVPATREVLGSLPNVFSALCLNTRGLNAFVACKPFERLFKVTSVAKQEYVDDNYCLIPFIP